MSKNERNEYLLDCFVDGEGLDTVLASFIAIAEKKARNQYADKITANQWNRTVRRLKELREWCSKFGPGSTCR